MHTPGPWSLHGENRTLIGAMDGKAMIGESHLANDCHPVRWRRATPEVQANARLMAAAPDMLKALEQMTDEMDSGAEVSQDTLDMASRAILKATGR